MTPFSPALLTELGIQLPADIQAELVAHLTATLQERIGLAIFDLLDDEQADALIAMQAHGNDIVIADWIRTNVEDYNDVIQDEYDLLIGELVADSQLIAV